MKWNVQATRYIVQLTFKTIPTGDAYSGMLECYSYTKLTHLLQCLEESAQERRLIVGKGSGISIEVRMAGKIQRWECEGNISVQKVQAHWKAGGWTGVDSHPSTERIVEYGDIGREGYGIVLNNRVFQKVVESIPKLGTD